MKAYHTYRLGLVLLIALLAGPLMTQQAKAQSPTCPGVTIRIFPVKPGNADLQNRVRSSVGQFLCSINEGSPDISDVEITPEDIEIVSTSETLHPVYKILLIPVVPPRGSIAYQVRGLHLDHDSGDDLQLALSLDENGMVIKAEVLDEEDRTSNWANALNEIGSLPQGEAVLNLIERLENAYNEDAVGVENGSSQMPNLSALLEDATINVSKLISGAPTRTTYSSSSDYIRALTRLIGRANGAPKITYELIQIYPHRDSVNDNGTGVYEDATIYRVALVQHWMFPPNNYIDTDYVSLDVEINPSPYIKARNAGRGSFTVDTNPNGIQVTEMNGMDWQGQNVMTPLDEFISAPWQYHYLTLDDTWYNTYYLVASPDQVLSHDTLRVDMEHSEGNIELTILPDNENVTVRVEDSAGNLDAATFVDEGMMLVEVDQLKGKPDPFGIITEAHATRQVRLVVDKTYYHTVDTTITLPSPELYPVTIRMRKKTGRLAVTTTPSPSSVLVNGGAFGNSPVDAEVEVTGDDEPLRVSSRNDTCYPGAIEQDCVLHIPSKGMEARIVENETTEMHIDLGPFVVRNLTKTAVIDVGLDREMGSDSVMIDVDIMDKDERNRAYIVDFQLHNRDTGELIDNVNENSFACYSENVCVGKGVRPGAYAMSWGDESAMPDYAVPVLTLRRKSVCWPCVLIPAAAGVAAAYIFPRTGSGGPLPFLPPPRPDDIP